MNKQSLQFFLYIPHYELIITIKGKRHDFFWGVGAGGGVGGERTLHKQKSNVPQPIGEIHQEETKKLGILGSAPRRQLYKT